MPSEPINKFDEEAAPMLPPADTLDSSTSHLLARKRKQRALTSISVSILSAVLFTSLFWLAFVIDTTSRSNECITADHDPPNLRHCGHTPAEARSLGCVFQLWSYSWVPDVCFDGGLQNDFLKLQSHEDWRYYTRPDGTPAEQVALDVVLAGDRNDLFSTWGQHFWHCAYYQRKFFRMLGDGNVGDVDLRMMTNRDRDGPHSVHCQNWLADPSKYEWSKVNINLTIGYHTCQVA